MRVKVFIAEDERSETGVVTAVKEVDVCKKRCRLVKSASTEANVWLTEP